jgi:hypothetical protein
VASITDRDETYMLLRKNLHVLLVLLVFLLLAGVPSFFPDCSPEGPEPGPTDLAFENPCPDDILIDQVTHLNPLMPEDLSGVSFLMDNWQELPSFSFQGSHFHRQVLPLRC